MRRAVVLGILLAAGSLSIALAAFQADQTAPVTVQKLRENLYLLPGGGGNTVVFIRSDGVVVVDTKNPGFGKDILTKIRELTNKPVTMIINTHTHVDHVSGNVEFPAAVDVVVQENTKGNMEQMRSPSGMPSQAASIFAQNNGRGLPKRTFKDRMTLGSGADEIDLYYFGRGHTNGDAWVVFPALRLLHAGDMFPGKNPPFLDGSNGGSGLEFPGTLTKAADTIKNVDTIVTGHSTTMEWSDLREYIQFTKDLVAYVEGAMKAGKTVDEAAAGYKVDESKYKGYKVLPAFLKPDVQTIYGELKK